MRILNDSLRFSNVAERTHAVLPLDFVDLRNLADLVEPLGHLSHAINIVFVGRPQEGVAANPVEDEALVVEEVCARCDEIPCSGAVSNLGHFEELLLNCNLSIRES